MFCPGSKKHGAPLERVSLFVACYKHFAPLERKQKHSCEREAPRRKAVASRRDFLSWG